MNSYLLIIQVGIILQMTVIVVANQTSFELPRNKNCKCGVVAMGTRSRMKSGMKLRILKTHIDEKIVNGKIMKKISHPHLALLMKMNRKNKFTHVCGGTIINNKYVLTAAHCFGENKRELLAVKKSDWQVRLGVHNKFYMNEGIYYSIADIITHKKYKKIESGGLDNDIALLKLNDTIPLTDFIRPACLPTTGPIDERVGTVQGWGKTETGQGSSQARNAILQILSDEDCKKSNIGPTMGEPHTKICAEDTTSDACQGDSGGPLFVEVDFKTTVIGIVSSGKSCGDFYFPGVYTKVEKFMSWIQEHTQDAEYCS